VRAQLQVSGCMLSAEKRTATAASLFALLLLDPGCVSGVLSSFPWSASVMQVLVCN
jgi:hypothetical protein